MWSVAADSSAGRRVIVSGAARVFTSLVMVAAMVTMLADGAVAAARQNIAGEFTAIGLAGTTLTLEISGDVEGVLTYDIGGNGRATTGMFEGTVLGSDSGTVDMRIVFAGTPNDGRVVAVGPTGTGGLAGITLNVRSSLDVGGNSGTYEGIAVTGP
jgi:hypothetical protein